MVVKVEVVLVALGVALVVLEVVVVVLEIIFGVQVGELLLDSVALERAIKGSHSLRGISQQCQITDNASTSTCEHASKGSHLA